METLLKDSLLETLLAPDVTSPWYLVGLRELDDGELLLLVEKETRNWNRKAALREAERRGLLELDRRSGCMGER
jgi:hypothetical protein